MESIATLLPPGPAAAKLSSSRQNPDRNLRSRHALGLLPRAARDRAPRPAVEAGIGDQQRPALPARWDDPRGHHGHEHVQRYGCGRARFRASASARPGRSSYLLDTYDTICSDPAAFKLIREIPAAATPSATNSATRRSNTATAVELCEEPGHPPLMILEDGWDLGLTQRFEALREARSAGSPRAVYGLRGHLVAATAPGTLTRTASPTVEAVADRRTPP